jgi:hypothetical protein
MPTVQALLVAAAVECRAEAVPEVPLPILESGANAMTRQCRACGADFQPTAGDMRYRRYRCPGCRVRSKLALSPQARERIFGPGRFTERARPEGATVSGNCWVWSGALDKKGYPVIGVSGLSSRAHNAAYVLAKGPLPEGMVLDHLCRVPACINPDHLEAVTNAVNVLRGGGFSAVNAVKTHCVHGHEFTPENTYMGKLGRACRKCAVDRNRKYRLAHRAKE